MKIKNKMKRVENNFESETGQKIEFYALYMF
jgi:hypothetical protein